VLPWRRNPVVHGFIYPSSKEGILASFEDGLRNCANLAKHLVRCIISDASNKIKAQKNPATAREVPEYFTPIIVPALEERSQANQSIHRTGDKPK
jgi:hypothetical protein